MPFDNLLEENLQSLLDFFLKNIFTQVPLYIRTKHMQHVCHLFFRSSQTLTGYDIYYFLSHIISTLHKELIGAFGDEAFNPLRKA